MSHPIQHLAEADNASKQLLAPVKQLNHRAKPLFTYGEILVPNRNGYDSTLHATTLLFAICMQLKAMREIFKANSAALSLMISGVDLVVNFPNVTLDLNNLCTAQYKNTLLLIQLIVPCLG